MYWVLLVGLLGLVLEFFHTVSGCRYFAFSNFLTTVIDQNKTLKKLRNKADTRLGLLHVKHVERFGHILCKIPEFFIWTNHCSSNFSSEKRGNLENPHTVYIRRGREIRWIITMNLSLLSSVIPCIWLLER